VEGIAWRSGSSGLGGIAIKKIAVEKALNAELDYHLDSELDRNSRKTLKDRYWRCRDIDTPRSQLDL